MDDLTPVCVATTSNGSLILSWYPSVEHYGRRWLIASASEYRFTTHPYIAEVPPQVQLAAQRAHRLITEGKTEQVRQMATHRVERFMFWRRPVPIGVVPQRVLDDAAARLLRGERRD